ncbi:MAG: 5-formyltetrahydrofolate cyclo-ligase [Pseudomonadota bacterium]|nr:5-formyltetrahydrofolate cyclo-ligase [Pseudomonadota bacterium]
MRRDILAQRASLSTEVIADSSRLICASVHEQWRALFADVRQVFLFHPVAKEPDLRNLVAFFRTQGIVVALPVVHGRAMHFKTWEADDQLGSNSFNIKEPSNGKVCTVDQQTLVFTPCLALDLSGHRLGFGRGYYDRFLAAHNVISIGVCLQLFLYKSLPREEHDCPVSYLLTEDGIKPSSRA